MEMFCPECMGVLVTSDGKWANCTLHGQRYEILFSRSDYQPPKVAEAQQQFASLPRSAEEKLRLLEKVLTRCPHCGQKYEVSAEKVGKKAQCKKCHLKFQITATGQEVTSSNVPEAEATESSGLDKTSQRTMCTKHPNLLANYTCARCDAPICQSCDFPQADGSHLCPDCVTKKDQTKPVPDIAEIKKTWQNEPDKWVLKAATMDIKEYPPEVAKIIREEAINRRLITQEDARKSESDVALADTGQAGSVVARQPAVPVGQLCMRHPGVQAVQICKVCGSAMCETCDFVFPGNIHLCPTCATSPRKGLKGKRRTYLIWSYILGVWSTLATLFFLSGAAAESVGSQADVEVLGIMMVFTMLVPAIIGMALGCSAMERHSKPISVWVATLWNGAIVGLFILLSIIGITMG